MMRAYLEIVNMKNDIVTTSGGGTTPITCCDWGCFTDIEQKLLEGQDDS